MLRKFFATRLFPLDMDVMLLLIRILCGYGFISFGWPKIQHPTSWMGNQDMFSGAFQSLAAVAEFVGGIALVLGLFTRLAAFGIICTMATAVWMLHFKMGAPFVNLQGGPSYFLPLLLLFIALLYLVNGPGGLSLDRLIFGTRRNTVLG